MTEPMTLMTAEGFTKRISVPKPKALLTGGFPQKGSHTENKHRRQSCSGCTTLAPEADLRHQVKSHGQYGERIS